MKPSRYPFVLAFLTLTAIALSGLSAEQPAWSDAPLVAEEVRQLMQDQNYAEAVKAIEKASREEDAPVDYLTYIKGRALYLQEQYDRAIATFGEFQQRFPDSPWARRARFGKALAMARKGDYRSAELIVRAEAEYLLSVDRKQQIAEIYLEFADAYFKPPEEENKPDYQKALEFYKKALEVGPEPKKRIEVELLVAQCHQHLGQQDQAAALYEKFIKDHEDSTLDVEARYRLGECRLAQGNLKLARRTWQDLLAEYPDSPSERIAEATFQLSRTWRIPQPGNNEELSLGTAALEAFIERFPKHKLASQAHLDIARSFIHRGRYEDAVTSLKRFIADDRYRQSEELPEGRNLLGRSYQLQKKFPEALATWKEYLTKHPAHQAWSSVQREIINTEYLMGQEKLNEEDYAGARKLWSEFLAKYPLDGRNRNILYQFGWMHHQQEKWEEAMADWKRLVSKYPNTNESSRAQYMIAATLEQELGRLEEALEEYRKVTWGNYAKGAKQAVARLTAKSMSVATERVFRSDETPVLKLTTRNIEEVTVSAYKIDMETYFRKMHLARGVEALDISLIDPDATFTFKVPDYAKYQELESEIEIPLPVKNEQAEANDASCPSPLAPRPSSGVMAVTVSSKTLEATTMVIQSDLDVIVKSSRDEVFVFAEDMRTGQPWGDVRLLISDGSEVFAEAITGADGVWQKSYKELKDAGDVRVFAIAGGHTASNVVGLQGVGIAQGLSDKGYIYTDRPAYRAGQMVHVRGCLRFVEGRGARDEGRGVEVPIPAPSQAPVALPPIEPPIDPAAGPPPALPPIPSPGEAAPSSGDDPFSSYVPSGPGPGPGDPAPGDVYLIEEGKQYTLEVFDGRNRLVRQEEVKLNAFGTFHAHFVLPATSPQGTYRVLVRDDDGHSYQGTFQVHQYQLEPVRLVIDVPRNVYYRGEEIEGTIKAAYYYGAPLADREIRYQLADDRLHTATTDEKGEVKFKLPTREYSETQILPLVVTLPERNLQTAVNFVLSSRGFSIGLSTLRPVYVAGETFEATVNTHDAEGKPVGRKLTLKVLEKTTVRGKVGERLVTEFPLETVEKDGTGRITLKLAEGGRYVIRVEGIDRFDNPISGEHLVQISDDEDEVRLRILADTHTYKVGDTATVKLHWREEPALALVTFQGARVLDYKLVELKQGSNDLEIPMTSRLAPNFELAVAVMTNTKPRPVVAPNVVAPNVVAPNVVAPNVVAPNVVAPDENVAPDQNDDKPIKRFHTASSPFTVQRELIVKLETHKAATAGRAPNEPPNNETPNNEPPNNEPPIRPGDELEVTITTTDPQGNPVAAEVSLAMVEQSLLDRFAWPVVPIQEFFRGTRRRPAVRTTSSIIFAYHPSTQPINPRLLAEQDRLEVAREEKASLRTAGDFVDGRYNGPVPPADPMVPPASQPVPTPGNGGEWGYADAGEGTSSNNARYARAPQSDSARMPGRGRGARPAQAAGVQLGEQLLGMSLDEEHFADLNANGTVLGNGQVNVNAGFAVLNGGTVQLDASALNLSGLVNQQFDQITVLDDSGSMRNLNLSFGTGEAHASAEAMAVELAKTGAVLLPGMTRQETGYWNPAIETGDDGKATVTFTVPERSTAWTLMAKGITTETLAGEATDEVIVKKELFGQMKLPLAFTDGDEAEVVASIHNDAIDQGQIQVVLKTTLAGRTVEEKKTVDVKAKGIHEVVFKTVLNRPEKSEGKETAAAAEIDVAFELTVTAGRLQDVVRRSIPLRPYGMPVYATAGGSATSDTTAWVEAPKDMRLEDPALQIIIGPTVQQSLLDIVFGPAPQCQIEVGRFTAGLERAASDLMAALALQKLVSASREAGGPQAQALDGRVRASIGLLVSAQNDDGGWSWTGRRGGSRRYGTARIVWALSLAKKAGYTVPEDTYNKALGYLRNQVAATPNSDYESKAILLHALSVAGQGDFALANRLYRERPALSNAALVYLALAFAEMDRDPTAKELLDLLAGRNLDDAASRRVDAQGCLPWSHSPIELRALYALGLQEVSPRTAQVKELVDWLLAHRTGHRFSPDKATGPAAMVLCRWFAGRSGLALTPGEGEDQGGRSGLALTRREGEDQGGRSGQALTRREGEDQGGLSGQALTYKLAIFVNDVQAAVLDIDETAGTQTVDVPASLLTEGKQRINFQITGRGRYTYQCILGGFVRAEKLKSTTGDWEIRRTYEPAPLEVDGREIPRGFGVLTGSYSTFKNPLTQLPVGRRGLVELYVRRNVSSNTPEQQLEYLVITEPIPSGTTVIEKSVTGPFERFEISPGAITFYVGSRRSIGTIRYELYGYLPGQYRAGPTVIRNAHRPEQLVVCGAKSLAVLPLGQQSTDKYRLTPQELYELGKHYFDQGEMGPASKHLAELIAKWNVNGNVYKHSVEMLLDAHLELGPAGQVVRYFEIIKEKWPAEEIPFDKILKVGRAYHEMGEYERSYLIFRATVESSFMRESGVAGFLQAQGEFLRSIDVMGRLLREYPPEGYIASATYALAQRVYAKAPEAAEDEKLRRQKINRVDLIQRAWEMLESFLTAYPEDPAADRAAFSTANALLELKDYDQAAAACNRYAKRYPDSDLLDSYWYMIGYCHFATGEHDAALQMCRKVAEAMRIDKTTGREVEARNKWRAIYILGQIHHSLGEAAEAIAEYRRVEDRFPDARQSIDYFTHKAIELPEVSTVTPGEKAEVELQFRNIATCDTKVYRIDLMKFSLLKQNLGGITRINLAGISPYYATTIELGDGKDYRDRTHDLPLPLEEEGAYLVVCRGENLHASGLVLVTPLEVEVQEDAASGRVRTTVKDRADDRYVSDVHVKVIGSHNNEFVSGETDLRGVFVADGVRGTSTVIAQAEGSRYAFFRGKTPLAVAVPEPAAEAPSQAQPAAQPSAQGKQMLLKGLQEYNFDIQREQVEMLQKVYESDQKGVEAQKAF